MANSSLFQHQDYRYEPSPKTYELVSPRETLRVGSAASDEALTTAGRLFADANVSRIVLVHGTLAGTDAMGWYGSWQRFMPGLSRKLKQGYKAIVDRLADDRGNFTSEYAQQLEWGINRESPRRIKVSRFEWSSENHHLGRSDAAVRLTHALLDYRESGERTLLIGHSHGGNVFALVTNLLSKQAPLNSDLFRRFFAAANVFNQSTRRIGVAEWKRLESRIRAQWESAGREESEVKLPDIVTLGTPVRYGWDATGYNQLLNFVNHVPDEEGSPYQGQFPKSRNQLIESLQGYYGDFVQQTFIARTDFPPAIWSWPAWNANRRLRKLLESRTNHGRLLDQLKLSLRVPNAGHTLLVNYAQADANANQICGHAVYTDLDWMPYHIREIATRFYGG